MPRPASYCPYDSPCQFAIVFVNPLLSLSSSNILLYFFPKLSTCMLNKVIWIIGYRNDESRFVFSSMEGALRSPWPTSTSRSSPSRSPPRLEKLYCKSRTFFSAKVDAYVFFHLPGQFLNEDSLSKVKLQESSNFFLQDS